MFLGSLSLSSVQLEVTSGNVICLVRAVVLGISLSF